MIFKSNKRLKDLKNKPVVSSFHLYKNNNNHYSRINFNLYDLNLEIDLEKEDSEKIANFIENIINNLNHINKNYKIKVVERKIDQLKSDNADTINKINCLENYYD